MWERCRVMILKHQQITIKVLIGLQFLPSGKVKCRQSIFNRQSYLISPSITETAFAEMVLKGFPLCFYLDNQRHDIKEND